MIVLFFSLTLLLFSEISSVIRPVVPCESTAIIDSLMEPGDLMAVFCLDNRGLAFAFSKQSFKRMPLDWLWFTVIPAPPQLEKKLFSNGTKSQTNKIVCD